MRLALIIKSVSLLHVLCCVVLLSSYAYANDSVVVIVNKHSAIDTLNAQQIRNLYLGDSRHSPLGEKITVINQRQSADSRAREILQCRAADSAKADDCDLSLRQCNLACTANLWDHNMACETVEAFGVKAHGTPIGRH